MDNDANEESMPGMAACSYRVWYVCMWLFMEPIHVSVYVGMCMVVVYCVYVCMYVCI